MGSRRRNAMYEGRAKRALVVKRMPGVEHVAGALSEEEVNFIARWAPLKSPRTST